MKTPLTKKEVYELIEERCSNSFILNYKRVKKPWKLNELIYCLELIDFNEDIHIDINTNDGKLYQIGSYREGPAYTPACDRNKTVNIVGFESYLLNEDDPEEGYANLLIIEEVK
jgi:hypothetical protein